MGAPPKKRQIATTRPLELISKAATGTSRSHRKEQPQVAKYEKTNEQRPRSTSARPERDQAKTARGQSDRPGKDRSRPAHASSGHPDKGPRRDRDENGKREAKHSDKPPIAYGPGFDTRKIAVNIIHEVMVRGRAFDGAVAREFSSPAGQALEGRDRALARLIAVTVLRRHGDLAAVLNTFLGKPLSEDKGKIWPILLSGAAQLLILEVQPHAAISLSVDVARTDPSAERFAKLVNAILRRTSETGSEILASLTGAARNVPDWMLQSWASEYGEEAAEGIAAASIIEPALDFTVKEDGPEWADKLGGIVLPTGSVRAKVSGRIEDLPGFENGAWWVQDAAAALPAQLFGDVGDKRIADLCAAPGGKTLQLAAAGANVVSVDISLTRLERLKENLARTKLNATSISADIFDWMPDEHFDGVLLDAPCTSTGTIRRHPDILHLKRDSDIPALAKLQAGLLRRVADFVAPGGTLIFCTCSLQPEEGAVQIKQFLERRPEFKRKPITPGEAGIREDWITSEGDLRTLPHLFPAEPAELSGIDGFFAARLVRQSSTS